jgi:hypothetical protein
MPITCDGLKARLNEHAAQEARIARAFDARKADHARQRDDKRRKRKTTPELWAMLNTLGIDHLAIRALDEYQPRSYNLDRQLASLINHLFVRYPVPGFLVETCMKWERNRPFYDWQSLYKEWFVTTAQGGSLRKAMKGVLSSKEVVLFLKAPYREVHENVWWAKLRYAGIPELITRTLLDKIFNHYFFDDPDGRLHEVLYFYANHHAEMDRRTVGDLADFIRYKLANDFEFRFKGRTVASMVELTARWHVLLQKAKLGSTIEWEGLNFGIWEVTEKCQRHRVVELLSNKELMNEGRKLRHCVYTYGGWCAQGRSSIFSLRSYNLNKTGQLDDEGQHILHESEYARATIEVSRSLMEVVQFRTLLNAAPNDDQRRLLNRWAGEKGVRLPSNAYSRWA